MFKKYFLLITLFSNCVLPMGNGNAEVPAKKGMSTTKKVLIGGTIGAGVVGGAVLLGPVVLPATTIASIKAACAAAAVKVTAAGVAVKTAAVSTAGAVKGYAVAVAAQSDTLTTLKVLGAVGGKAINDCQGTKSVSDRDMVTTARCVYTAAEGVRDEICRMRASIPNQPIRSAQDVMVEKLEQTRSQRKSLAESINQAYGPSSLDIDKNGRMSLYEECYGKNYV